MTHPLLNPDGGTTELLLGNEAIVRGALEAGVRVVSCYPGTPSSEVPDTFFRLSPQLENLHFEYSVNEKVAMEVAGGAALTGALALVTMKHVGLNVAADPLMSLCYGGVPGGLVLLCADDPGCHSSQNEQDNRAFARLAGMPVFEPADAQEAKDMTREALLYSRRWQQPVMLRTTTRVNHMRGPVSLGPLPKPEDLPSVAGFKRDPFRHVLIPAVARARHPVLLNNLAGMAAEAETSPWQLATGRGELGVVATGISRAYLLDALDELDLTGEVAALELGQTYPLPEKSLLKFMQGRKKLLVLEEGEPILETELRAMAQQHGVQLEIFGKAQGKSAGGLSRLGEYDAALVTGAVGELAGKNVDRPQPCSAKDVHLPNRPPNLCAGCPHRATYYAVKKVFGTDAVYSSDIGCYTLGLLPPLSAADFLLCMGSSVSAGSGAAAAAAMSDAKAPVVAFIGDSTFFHSGITGLVNAVFNKHNLILVILDNRTTAMTGHQPHPGVDATVHGACEAALDIEAVVRGLGVCQVANVNPLNVKNTMDALAEFKSGSGVRVLIATEPCPLHARRLKLKKYPRVAYVAEQGEDVNAVLDELACPAFYKDGETVGIDPELCSGCMACVQLAQGIKTAAREGA